jgi:glutaredoxin|tara:strand:+ start:616 stop:891 length:276 start_codon:yes stop_codon:yes gene_type:complete
MTDFSRKLVLFTKDSCYYCHMLKEKLDDWNIEYEVLNNHPLPDGHKTYPQLYYRQHDVQQGNSVDLTEEDLWDRIRTLEWTSQDSGVEGGF